MKSKARRLEGKIAIVTGAARGVGRAFSLGMAEEGANVVAVDIEGASKTVSAVEGLGRKALALRLDISKEEDTIKMAREAIDVFGKIDILVNNAGVMALQPFSRMTFADWKKITSVNIDGVFLCIKSVVPYMKKQKYGRIINISSDVFLLGTPYLVHYVASKGAVIGITRGLAPEVGTHGITINCIAPGLVETEGIKEMPKVEPFWDMAISVQAIKRREKPEDLVGTAVFLASDDASFMTGQTLCVDGGLARI